MLVANLDFPQIFSLLSALFILTLGFVVVTKGKTLTHKLFFFLTLLLTVWLIGSFMMFSGASDAQITFWDRFIYGGIVFWPIVQYHFGLSVTYFNKRRKLILATGYLISIFFLFLSRTDYFVSGVFHYKWGVHTIAQIGHHFYLFVFLIYSLFFFSHLIKQYRAENSKLKKDQIAVFIIGFFLLNLIGALGYLPAYGIPIYPVSLISPLIFSILITYAIVYYGLMNIKLIMRRSLVYFLSFISILIPAAIWLYFFYLLIPAYLNLAYLLILILSLSIFSELKRQYYKLSNKYFFSSLYDTRELIYNLNNRLRSSLDLDRIFRSLADILMPAFHNQAIAAVNYSRPLNRWSILYNNGFHFANKYKLVLDYEEASRIFIAHRPLAIAKIEKLTDHQPSPFLVSLENLQIAVIVPINIKDKLTHLLFFGAKESGEAYNQNDLEVLETIGTEVGIALENALLYQRVKRFNVKLKEEITKATARLQEQNEALQKLDKAKDEFVSIVSHQLRTPLTSIRWFTELLTGNKAKNLTLEQQEFLQQIGASNKKMIRLIDDLLDVSHIETGRKFTIIKKSFLVDELIKEVVQESIFLITTKKLRVVNDIPETLAVSADRDKIKQVWQNLLSNAAKYTRPNKEIKIAAASETDKTIFSIQDQGIGVPAGQQGRLFEKFFRADNASLQDPEGTGLGLYIAREIIKAHGGDMWLKSEENKGSTFYFSLPKKSSAAKIGAAKIGKTVIS